MSESLLESLKTLSTFLSVVCFSTIVYGYKHDSRILAVIRLVLSLIIISLGAITGQLLLALIWTLITILTIGKMAFDEAKKEQDSEDTE